jgi:hypothetical protein
VHKVDRQKWVMHKVDTRVLFVFEPKVSKVWGQCTK